MRTIKAHVLLAFVVLMLVGCAPAADVAPMATAVAGGGSTPALRGTRLLLAGAERDEGRIDLTVTSPVRRGAKATAMARTAAGSSCAIAVRYASGPSEAAGLDPQTAGEDGMLSWSWTVGTRTTPGTWEVEVTCIDPQGRSSSGRAVVTVLDPDPPHPSAEAGP